MCLQAGEIDGPFPRRRLITQVSYLYCNKFHNDRIVHDDLLDEPEYGAAQVPIVQKIGLSALQGLPPRSPQPAGSAINRAVIS